MYFSRRKSRSDFDQNDGIPGVVYILSNPAFRENYFKIGCTRYSGYKRAEALNNAAGTGTPGTFECIFQFRTRDCGRAEKLVFRRLRKFRRGKWGQEFFELQLGFAKHVIIDSCKQINAAATAMPADSGWRKRRMGALTPRARPRFRRRGRSPLEGKIALLADRRKLMHMINVRAACWAIIGASLAITIFSIVASPHLGGW